MSKDLDDALKLLKLAPKEEANLNPDSRRHLYSALKDVERDLSYHHPSSNIEESLSRIDKAEQWRSKLAELPSLGRGPRKYVELERYLFLGRKASLELEKTPNLEEARRSISSASEGVDRLLEELKKEDLTLYNNVEESVQKKQRQFAGPLLITQ